MKKIYVIALLMIVFTVGVGSMLKANALTEYWYWRQTGREYFSNYSRGTTSFDGKVELTPYVFSSDKAVFTGDSKSYVETGNYGYWFSWNVDTVTHRDVLGLDGIGSLSVGYPSGVGVTTSGSSVSISYSADNTWKVEKIDYDYLMKLGVITSVSQDSFGDFKNGSTFYDVSSRNDEIDSYKSSHYFK